MLDVALGMHYISEKGFVHRVSLIIMLTWDGHNTCMPYGTAYYIATVA